MPDDPDKPRDPGQDQLLPGEPSRSDKPEDTRHWIEVYRELLTAKQSLLDEISVQRREVEPPAKAELENDRKLMQREADRLERRLRFWERELNRRGLA